MNFTQAMYQLQHFFDLGVNIIANSDLVVIKGYDSCGDADNHAIEKTYEFEFDRDEHGNLIDNYSNIVEEIIQDRN